VIDNSLHFLYAYSHYVYKPLITDKKFSLIWLIHWLFVQQSLVTIDHGGLQNLGLCWALRAFGHWARGYLYMSHLLWHRVSVYPVSFEGPPYLFASYDTKRGCWGLILFRILAWLQIILVSLSLFIFTSKTNKNPAALPESMTQTMQSSFCMKDIFNFTGFGLLSSGSI
jgi:hypothetical protein